MCRLVRETFEPQLLTADSHFNANGTATTVIEVRNYDRQQQCRSWCGAVVHAFHLTPPCWQPRWQ